MRCCQPAAKGPPTCQHALYRYPHNPPPPPSRPPLPPGAPELLQAVGLRLLALLWRRTGRGYQQLRTAILGVWVGRECGCVGGPCVVAVGRRVRSWGRMRAHNLASDLLRGAPVLCPPLFPPRAGYAPPGKAPTLEQRVARLECVRDVCAADPDKGVEYVALMQARAWVCAASGCLV